MGRRPLVAGKCAAVGRRNRIGLADLKVTPGKIGDGDLVVGHSVVRTHYGYMDYIDGKPHFVSLHSGP